MGEQQSRKRGLRSAPQKAVRARDAKAPAAPSKPAGGAFGDPTSKRESDEELSLWFEERLARQTGRRKKTSE
ncbi:MAG: hypothetical protein AABM67_08685 [Acidobacteriota bacterium]